jgi:hypothetical protein
MENNEHTKLRNKQGWVSREKSLIASENAILQEKVACMKEIQKVKDERDRLKADIELREERIDELVRSLKDLKEAYEGLCAEREIMLQYSQPAHKINYPDGTFIFRTKSITMDDLDRWGYERGDQLRFLIVKTPLAKINKH